MSILNMRNGLENIMKIGYALILVSIGLMIWASSVRAVNIPDPPCIFSSLCSCTQFHPDNFGNVKCVNVEHPMIPRDINMSRVYQLKMDNTGLMEIENNAFQQTGIYRMEIMNNPLYDIPDGAFYGLERSLVDLILKNNRLIEVPTKALRHLTKLKTLDLSGNEIGSIARDSFRGLQDTLEILNLADNSIRFLPIDTFHGVPRLTSIDLSSNNLMEIETDVFREQIDRLERVNLADNLLVEIPFMPLSLLKRLKYLDLSSNRIFDFRMLEIEKERNLLGKLSLDELHLEHNEIQFVKTASFQYFLTANKTFLDFNPIHTISDSAFQSARIRELYIRHCKLDFIDPSAFSGLESSLQILDLSGNNITALPENLLRAFDFLAMLNVKDNRIRTIFPKNAAILSDMQRLDISGENHDPINLQELRRFDRLRTLTVGKLTKDSLMAEDFIGYGTHLENLRIYKAGLRSIKANAFVHLRGLKRLDLSENMIDSIEKGSFRDLGMSLISLKIVHGFSTSFSQFPDIRELEGLKQIDFSNNRLRTLTDQSLYSLKNIEIVNLNDNQIEHLPRGTFQSDIHRRLEEVSIEFNFIKNIITHCFVDLEKLTTIKLRDNKIERIERRAFMNLNKVTYISLRGNHLSSISQEAFENLPELRLLDLAYNRLKVFDFDYFDQIGTLSHLSVNVSHNVIRELSDNSTLMNFNTLEDPCIDDIILGHSDNYPSYIKVLDLSYNNISRIDPAYFRSAENSLIHLDLAHNYLQNISRDIFGNFHRLTILDLSNNYIDYIPPMTFVNAKRIQVINLAKNGLRDFSQDTFRYLDDLRIVDLSSNDLVTLPETTFQRCRLEKIDLSDNNFDRIPSNGFSNLATMDLIDLDLSHNKIGTRNNGTVSMTLSSQHLSRLDLSYNKIEKFEDAAFATLPSLIMLDLSHNNELEVYGRVFKGLENCLKSLKLNNISLIQAPELSLPNLRELEITHNELPTIPQELAANLTSIRSLDISFNDLPSVPLLIHSLPNLKELSIAGNPITSLTNVSFIGVADTLESLDIANLQLTSLETGLVSNFNSLRELTLSTYSEVRGFGVPAILEETFGLRTLRMEAPAPRVVKVVTLEGVESYQLVQDGASDLKFEFANGVLPRKLKHFIISGAGFTRLAEGIFEGVQSSALKISIINTTISVLPRNLFHKIGDAYNLTIDIDSNNKMIGSFPNPHTATHLNMEDQVYLIDLNLHYVSFSCDCEIGWVEYWQRLRRQHFCSSQDWPDDIDVKNQIESNIECDEIYPDDEDYRLVRCSNKNSETLLEVLKNELECGWSGASSNHVNLIISTIVTFALMIFLV